MSAAEDSQLFLAKALYDNMAETPDELTFRRGDVLTVLQQDTAGLDGWWLCSLKGRQGIAPGNRLKILSGMVMDTGGGGGVPPAMMLKKEEWRRSLEFGGHPNKTLPAGSPGNTTINDPSSLYSHPTTQTTQPVRGMEDYDVPPTRDHPKHLQEEPGQETYDVPSSLPAHPHYQGPNSSFYDTPPSSKRASSERATPPSSQRASMDSLGSASSLNYRLSGGDQGQVSFYQTPPSSKRASVESGSHRFSGGGGGGERYYDTPPSSKRSSLERILSDEHPTYDTPPPTSGRGVVGEVGGGGRGDGGQATYDTPTPGGGGSRRHSRDSGSRGSVLSNVSVESGVGGSSSHLHHSSSSNNRHSGAASLDSARSSLDASLMMMTHEPLDVPGPPSRETRALKQLSMDSGLGSFYDTPGLGPGPGPQGRQTLSTSPQPPHTHHQHSLVHSASQNLDYGGRARAEQRNSDIKRSRSLENALDDFYDSPRNNAPKVGLKSGVHAFGSSTSVNTNVNVNHQHHPHHDPNAVYDIPPQVTRDSVISARSDSSSDNDGSSVRLSSCSMDSRGSSGGAGNEYCAVAEGIYEELLLDLDSAAELLVKVQQDVTRSAARVLTFVTANWRSKENLQTNVFELRVACTDLKRALGQFMEFAQGALANSARLSSDRKLVSRLARHVTPLQQTRRCVSETLRALEEDVKWQVALLVEPPLAAGESAEVDASNPEQDHLGRLISLTKDLVPDVKKLASLIQGNSTLLFKRSSDIAAQSQSQSRLDMSAKPPVGPKPEVGVSLPLPHKSGVGVIIPRARTVQQRPLPAPPVSRRPLPPTPLEQRLKSLEISASQDSLNQYADYVNVNDERRYTVADDDDDGDRDYSDLQQEYDYVQLEDCDAEAQQRRIDEQRKQQKLQEEQEEHHQQQQEQEQKLQVQQSQSTLNNITEEAEPPTTPNTDTKKSPCSEQDRANDNEDDDTLEVIEMDSSASTDTVTKPEVPAKQQKHIDRMSADLGDNMLLDIDLVPTKEDSSLGAISATQGQDIPDGGKAANADASTDLSDVRIPSSSQHPSNCGKLSMGSSGWTLEPSDKQVLCYYSGQLETHCTLLTNAIDAFFTCVQNKEPPKTFISNSKFVIVTAHKLVYMGDALHRSLLNQQVRDRVLQCAEHVCQCLKVSVAATKTAALQYPSLPAMQDMVDRVVDVSHAAHELKLVISQASAL